MTAAEGFVRWWHAPDEMSVGVHISNLRRKDYYITCSGTITGRMGPMADTPDLAWEITAKLLKEELLCRMKQGQVNQTLSH